VIEGKIPGERKCPTIPPEKIVNLADQFSEALNQKKPSKRKEKVNDIYDYHLKECGIIQWEIMPRDLIEESEKKRIINITATEKYGIHGLILASFKITESSLENLKSEGLPEEILKKLESIKGERFIGEKDFLDIISETIGEQQTDTYKLILKHASEKDEDGKEKKDIHNQLLNEGWNEVMNHDKEFKKLTSHDEFLDFLQQVPDYSKDAYEDTLYTFYKLLKEREENEIKFDRYYPFLLIEDGEFTFFTLLWFFRYCNDRWFVFRPPDTPDKGFASETTLNEFLMIIGIVKAFDKEEAIITQRWKSLLQWLDRTRSRINNKANEKRYRNNKIDLFVSVLPVKRFDYTDSERNFISNLIDFFLSVKLGKWLAKWKGSSSEEDFKFENAQVFNDNCLEVLKQHLKEHRLIEETIPKCSPEGANILSDQIINRLCRAVFLPLEFLFRAGLPYEMHLLIIPYNWVETEIGNKPLPAPASLAFLTLIGSLREDVIKAIYGTSFKLTEQSYKVLKEDGLPKDTLIKLEVKNEEFKSEEKLLEAITKAIGPQQTVKYKSAILTSAQIDSKMKISNWLSPYWSLMSYLNGELSQKIIKDASKLIGITEEAESQIEKWAHALHSKLYPIENYNKLLEKELSITKELVQEKKIKDTFSKISISLKAMHKAITMLAYARRIHDKLAEDSVYGNKETLLFLYKQSKIKQEKLFSFRKRHLGSLLSEAFEILAAKIALKTGQFSIIETEFPELFRVSENPHYIDKTPIISLKELRSFFHEKLPITFNKGATEIEFEDLEVWEEIYLLGEKSPFYFDAALGVIVDEIFSNAVKNFHKQKKGESQLNISLKIKPYLNDYTSVFKMYCAELLVKNSFNADEILSELKKKNYDMIAFYKEKGKGLGIEFNSYLTNILTGDKNNFKMKYNPKERVTKTTLIFPVYAEKF